MIKLRTEVQVALVIKEGTVADEVAWLRDQIQLKHRCCNAPNAVRIGHAYVNRIPLCGLWNDVVAVLASNPGAYWPPLGFFGGSKNSRVVRPVTQKK